MSALRRHDHVRPPSRSLRPALASLALVLAACTGEPSSATGVAPDGDDSTSSGGAPSTGDVGTGSSGSSDTGEPTGGSNLDDPCAACGPGTYCQFEGGDSCASAVECVPLPDGCALEDLCSLPCVHQLCGAYTCTLGACDIAGAISGCVGPLSCDPLGVDPCGSVEGTTCKRISDDDGNTWDEFQCVPTPAPGVALGEPCGVLSDEHWLWNDCAPGSECFNAGEGGTCKALCAGDGGSCPDPGTVCTQYGDSFALCEALCDPLAADPCVAGEVCVAGGDAFVCVPDVSGEGGGVFDGCESVNACDPGLACVDAEAAGCDLGSSGCCVPLCDLTQPMCPDDYTCESYHAPQEPPPGQQDLGLCTPVP